MKRFRFLVEIEGIQKVEILTEKEVRDYAWVPDDEPITDAVLESAMEAWHWEKVGTSWEEV